ncbi:MAG: 16S rRNA (guanine(966)-N(2))-methyltransferase RsmD [Pyrinomonadaceae bacterium]
MDTRRPTTNTSKPFTRNNSFKKEGERTFGERKYPPRDNRFQPRDNRFQDKDNRFQKRDGKYPPRDNRFQPRGRFAPKGKNLKPWEKINKTRIVSEMQITDGKHRGKYVQTTASPKLLATSRRIRETMFKILFRRVRAGRFLDLCAGSGMVGIEAISRGALIGTFVERSSKMCSFIKKNLASCGIKEGHGEIVEMEAVPFMKKMSKRRRFWDVVFFDPPYDSNYEEALKYFARGITIKPHGVLVIEHHADMFFPEKIGVMKRWRVIIQGESAISFYERK